MASWSCGGLSTGDDRRWPRSASIRRTGGRSVGVGDRSGTSRRRWSTASPAPTRWWPRPPGTCWTPAGSGSGRCWWRWPRSSATRHAREVGQAAVGGGADPPRHPVPRRRHGRGGRAPRARPAPTPAGATRWRSWSATTCSPAPPTSPPSSGPEAVRIQARTFSRLVHGQIAETVGPARAATRSTHYLRVIAREDRLADRDVGPVRRACSAACAGAHVEALAAVRRDDRHRVPALRRPARHRLGVGRSPARRPAPTCARACRRCRCSTRWPTTTTDAAAVRLREILGAGPITDDALHAEALGLLRESAAHEAGPGDRPRLRRGGRAPSSPPLPRRAAAARAGGAVRLHRRPDELSSALPPSISTPAATIAAAATIHIVG